MLVEVRKCSWKMILSNIEYVGILSEMYIRHGSHACCSDRL